VADGLGGGERRHGLRQEHFVELLDQVRADLFDV
jgi:hypothetical protein